MTPEQVELAQKVMAFIDANPERHEQGSWLGLREEHYDLLRPLCGERRAAKFEPCGTTACYAGWTVHLANPGATMRLARGLDVEMVLPDGTVLGEVDMRRWAIYALGLADDTADALFSGDRTRDQLRELVGLLPDEDAVTELVDNWERVADCPCGDPLCRD